LNKRIITATLGAFASVFILATPGYSSTFLAFSAGAGSTGGTAVVTGNTSAETLTSVTGIFYNTLIISGNANAADDGTWTILDAAGDAGSKGTLTLSGNTFTLTGKIGTCSGCGAGTPNLSGISGALETFTVSSKAYNTGANASSNAVAGFFTTPLPAQNAFTLAFGTPTSITTLASLTSALSFGAGAVASTETSGGIISNTPAAGTGPYTFTATSETLNVTLTSTPEPVSFLLVGGGLIGLAFFGRRRTARS
jgi:hypothetical protein